MFSRCCFITAKSGTRRRLLHGKTMLALVQNSVMPRRSTFQSTPAAPLVAPELGRAFNAACHRDTPENSETMRSAVVAFVYRLKRDSLPPERVVVALKTALVRYGGRDTPPSLTDQSLDPQKSHRAAVYSRLFGWCLDAYFDGQ
jgi:hypothetical protein